jgi:hypothetical protein
MIAAATLAVYATRRMGRRSRWRWGVFWAYVVSSVCGIAVKEDCGAQRRRR